MGRGVLRRGPCARRCSSVLEALLAAARQRGDVQSVLHAQLSAQPFYARAGFAPRGPVFDEAGIAHIEMTRGL